MLKPKFVKFKGSLLSEPSGVTLMADGRFLVVNDVSSKKALYVLRNIDKDKLKAKKLNFSPKPKMDDLEGVVARGEYYYAISSHDKKRKKTKRIVRFQVTGNKVDNLLDAKGSHRLKKRIRKALCAKHPRLNRAKFAGKKFNIEGFVEHDDEFIFGLRSPLKGKSALIVRSSGLSSSFGSKAKKYGVTAYFEPLNLNGGGIRAMSFMPDLGGYLIVSGRSVSGIRSFPCMPGSGKKSKFLLWFWDGKNCCKKILCFKKKQGKRKIQPEGICPAIVNGRPSVLIVSDDGKEKHNVQARFWLASTDEYRELKENI